MPRSSNILPAVTLLLAAATPARAQLQIGAPDGKQSFKIGVLGQFQAEAIDNPAGAAGAPNTSTDSGTSKNLFIRRFRILGQYTLYQKVIVFFETDAPNLGKGNPDGTKNTQDIFLQDAHVTYAHNARLNIDAGMMFLAQSYNHETSAATLMALDYGPYTFLQSGPTTSRNGRDYGLRLRGLLSRLEYRVALVQGLRGANSTNPLRVQGRVAYDLFDPQPGFFYRGTSLGKNRTVALGANFDVQKSYKALGGDVYYDQPLRGGDGFTLQVGFTHWDGGSFLTAIPKQYTTLVETGYYFHKAKLQPYVQYARQDLSDSTADEQRPQVGLGYYFVGHNSNLKLAYTRIDKHGTAKRNQFQLQYQVFAF
jgi:Gram-negative porin